MKKTFEVKFLTTDLGIITCSEEQFRRQMPNSPTLTLAELVEKHNSRLGSLQAWIVPVSQKELADRERIKEQALMREVRCVWCDKSIRTIKVSNLTDAAPKHYEFCDKGCLDGYVRRNAPAPEYHNPPSYSNNRYEPEPPAYRHSSPDGRGLCAAEDDIYARMPDHI